MKSIARRTMSKPNRSKTFTRKQSTTPMELQSLPISKQDEIHHFIHPQHPLTLVTFPYLFTCMGCKEHGAGRRYRCQECDFDLHDFCALAPPSLHNHPLHSAHQLVFYPKPGGFLRSKCEVCSKSTKGFSFRCNSCYFEMHPCCAMLGREIDYPAHPHTLNLVPSMLSAAGDANFFCSACLRKRPGWVYRCPVCDYHLHAVCAKDVINGLYNQGITVPAKSNVLGAAARFASHAVLGFIGGLIDGIGEGVGEVLIENIGRGRPRTIKKHIKNEAEDTKT